jgi:hypothetical protein
MRDQTSKAWEAVVKQERISERWKEELKNTVQAYEKELAKVKKECRRLIKEMNERSI